MEAVGSVSRGKTPSTSGRKKAAAKPRTDPVLEYACDVVEGRILAGPLVRAACQRHLDDLRDGVFEWRLDRALRVIEFFRDVLTFPDAKNEETGEFVPFVLSPWEAFVVGSIFGWYDPRDGSRRFRVAYVEVGKGNGKTPLAAGIGLYMLTADGEQGAEVYASGAVKDQAKIAFRDAAIMTQQSEDLSDLLVIHGDKEVYALVNSETNGFFKPISSERRGLDGKRVYCSLIDELHEHFDATVTEKMRAGTKGRKNPLIFEITNSGVDRTSICYQHHEYSERILLGLAKTSDATPLGEDEEIGGDHWFAYVCGLDEKDDPFKDPKCWIKANPNLGVSIQPKYLRELVREARGMPAKESIVRRLNFCEWVDAENPWIDGDLYRACEKTVEVTDAELAAAREVAVAAHPDARPDAPEVVVRRYDVVFERFREFIKGRRTYGGLDLSGTRDLTAHATVAEPDAKGVLDAFVEYWTPGETLRERAKVDRVPYDVWVADGYLRATPGRAVDYAFAAHRIGDLKTLVGLEAIAFDPYRIKYFEKDLANANVDLRLVPHGQGFFKASDKDARDKAKAQHQDPPPDLWMPRSIELLEEHVMKAKIRIWFNPCFRWNSASAVLEADPKNNRIFTKRGSKGRIDGLVALTMAIGLALNNRAKPKTYQLLFV